MNWTIISVDDLRAVLAGDCVDGAPPSFVADAIAEAVAIVRGAAAAGNALDANTAAVPGSLRALGARLAVRTLRERMGIGLTPELRAAGVADALRLAELREEAQRVEPADRAVGGSVGGVQTVVPGNSGHGREELRGL